MNKQEFKVDGNTVFSLEFDSYRNAEPQYRNRIYAFVQAHKDVPKEEVTATAKLFAAAPDLLEALIGLDEAFCSLNDNMTREERHEARLKLIAARAAIAKATGENE
jgi:hypothetical protein